MKTACIFLVEIEQSDLKTLAESLNQLLHRLSAKIFCHSITASGNKNGRNFYHRLHSSINFSEIFSLLATYRHQGTVPNIGLCPSFSSKTTNGEFYVSTSIGSTINIIDIKIKLADDVDNYFDFCFNIFSWAADAYEARYGTLDVSDCWIEGRSDTAPPLGLAFALPRVMSVDEAPNLPPIWRTTRRASLYRLQPMPWDDLAAFRHHDLLREIYQANPNLSYRPAISGPIDWSQFDGIEPMQPERRRKINFKPPVKLGNALRFAPKTIVSRWGDLVLLAAYLHLCDYKDEYYRLTSYLQMRVAADPDLGYAIAEAMSHVTFDEQLPADISAIAASFAGFVLTGDSLFAGDNLPLHESEQGTIGTDPAVEPKN